MRAALRLERFENKGRFAGYMGRDKSNPWVARITGPDPQYGLAREFQRGYADYSAASGTGGRGIWLLYALDDGVYEVNKRLSWKHTKRYFVRVQDGDIAEITREEVERWLQDGL